MEFTAMTLILRLVHQIFLWPHT